MCPLSTFQAYNTVNTAPFGLFYMHSPSGRNTLGLLQKQKEGGPMRGQGSRLEHVVQEENGITDLPGELTEKTHKYRN